MSSGSTQAPVGCPNAEAGLESEPIPKGYATSVDLRQQPFCEHSACGTSEWVTGASVSEVGLALAAAGFMCTSTRKWGWGLG